MGLKKLSMVEKTKALALLEQGISVICVAPELKVSHQAIYDLKKAAATVSEGATPSRKLGTGRKRLTSLCTDMMLKKEVIANPSVTATSLRNNQPPGAQKRSNMQHPASAALKPEYANVPRHQDTPPHGCHAKETDCILQEIPRLDIRPVEIGRVFG